jgi:hypothetical protein
LQYLKPPQILIIPEEYDSFNRKASLQDVHLYQQKIRSILYTTTITRPDITCTVSKLSEFLQNPLSYYQAAADQVVAYLYSIKTLAIEFSESIDKEKIFIAASNAVFADNKTT